jgi:ribosome-binding protein aMBF1 (putative translation factor)
MSPEDIAFTREVFGLSQRELARSLNVAPFTVARWEAGQSSPTGLQDEVLRALHTVALQKAGSREPQSSKMIGGLLLLGIGGLLVSALNSAGMSGATVRPVRSRRASKKKR